MESDGCKLMIFILFILLIFTTGVYYIIREASIYILVLVEASTSIYIAAIDLVLSCTFIAGRTANIESLDILGTSHIKLAYQ